MESPFPGMDPYIEACGLWEDFHYALIYEIKRAILRSVPSRYVVRTVERSYLVLVESEGKSDYPFVPDVSVATRGGRKKGSKKGGTAVAEPAATEQPHVLRAFLEEEHREAFVEIYEKNPALRLVTAIEILSPSNKRPGTPGWDLYLRKRQSLLLGDTNLVEIDLLRGGTRLPMLDPWPNSPYTLMVARARKPHACLVWEAHFQRPLPTISVPLAKPDPPIALDLQPLLATIYQESRYEGSIDYTTALTPPLSPEDEAWCKQLLQARPGAP